MDSITLNEYKHKAQSINERNVDYLSLTPADFFSKKMNISIEALSNLFIFWKKSIASFLNNNYVAHDALVGENACHIRAYALTDIAFIISNNDHFRLSLVSMLTELKTVIDTLKDLRITKEDTNASVKDFLVKHHLIFLLPGIFIKNIKYIIDSYLLTVTKESLPTTGLTLREKTTYQPVRDWGFSYNRAQYLVHNTQKEFSAASCSYIISEANQLKNNSWPLLLRIKKDAHGRSFIPQFFTAKILFLRALELNRPILIKITRFHNLLPIDTLALKFKPNLDKSDFKLCTNPWNETPCIVIESVVNYFETPETIDEYKERLLSHSMLDLILANFAIHPQYSGELKGLPPPFDEVIDMLDRHNDQNTINQILTEKKAFEKSRQYARETGCSFDNAATLFINHMYSDAPANHVQDLDNEIIYSDIAMNKQHIWEPGSQSLYS